MSHRGLALLPACFLPIVACSVAPSTEPTETSSAAALSIAPISIAPLYRVASTADALVTMLNEDAPGAIYVPPGVGLDLSRYRNLPLKKGVHLFGGRSGTTEGGHVYDLNDGTSPPPCVDANPCDANYPLFVVQGDDVRIDHLRIEGPYKGGDPNTIRAHATGIAVNAAAYKNFQIDHSELWGWNEQAIVISGNGGLDFHDAQSWRVLDNYIHDNVQDGGGYGIDVGGTFATIEGNVFDHNRHSIASDGSLGSGYLAHYNYVLEGGRCQPSTVGCYYNQHFDVHGVGPGGYGVMAGYGFDIALNTFRGAQTYYVFNTRPAVWLRADPIDVANIHDNVFVHADKDAAVNYSGDDPADHLIVANNVYHTDPSSNVLVGDLDADGRDDLLLATGVAWYYSSAGLTEWRRLNDMDGLPSEMVLGQFDDDPRLDVFTVRGGKWFFSSGGTGPWQQLGTITTSEPIGNLRFGFFDGDRKTDVIRSDGYTVWVSYGGTGPWLPLTQAQGIPLSQLLLGDIDGDGKTDMFHINTFTNGWYWKRDGVGGWSWLRSAVYTSLEGMTLADFDGDGRADLARLANDGSWVYWSGASSASSFPLHKPGSGDDVSVGDGRLLLVGRFGGDAKRADLVAWKNTWYQSGGNDWWGSPFAISLDGTASWLRWSRHPMR